jgi:hypothetical protein
MAREHHALVNALESLQPPEFDQVIRKTLTGFALRWITSISSTASGSAAPAAAERQPA